MFGATSAFGGAPSSTGMFSQSATTASGTHNPMKDIEVTSPPDDSISALAFSPGTLPTTFLIAGSWDNNIRCWEVQNTGATIPKAQQSHQGSVLDVCWNDDGTKVFSASCDKTAKMWDLNSNQAMQVAQHDAPIKTIHFIKAPNYSCIMTGSWDRTLKFWDTRSSSPMKSIPLSERCFCADVLYPMAVVGLAGKKINMYRLENGPQDYKVNQDSPLKFQHRCVAIFQDAKKTIPAGYALGSIEGRCAIQFEPVTNPKDNFTFKCHRSNGASSYPSVQDIYAVNSIAFHPEHGTLATAGSNGKFSFWDKDARTKLKTSEEMENPITSCTFDAKGNIFAYSVSYDWSRGHEYFNPQKKNYIFLRGNAMEELRPRNRKR